MAGPGLPASAAAVRWLRRRAASSVPREELLPPGGSGDESCRAWRGIRSGDGDWAGCGCASALPPVSCGQSTLFRLAGALRTAAGMLLQMLRLAVVAGNRQDRQTGQIATSTLCG